MIVRELITKLGFSADDAAVNKHERALKNLKVAAVAASAAVAAIGAAAVSAAIGTANAAREIDQMARLSNAGTTEFQRMAAAAGTVGIESDKLSDILKDMNDRVGDFVQTGGGPMLDFFEQIGPKIGVTIEDFKDLSGPDALQLYVSSLEKANLSQADMVFFMEAIASDSTALLPILQNNGEALDQIADRAERFGAVLSEDAIKAGTDFTKSVGGISQILTGLKYTVGTALLPVMTEFIDKFLEWYDVNGELIRQNLVKFIDGFSYAVGLLWSGLSLIGGVVDAIAQSMGGWEVVMRLVASAMSIVAGRAIIAGIASLASGITAAGGAAAFMRTMLMRIPGILALMAFAAVLEDIWAWVNGSESAIGKLLGSWDDFSTSWSATINTITKTLSGMWDSIKLIFGGIVDFIVGVFTGDFEKAFGGLKDIFGGFFEFWSGQWALIGSALSGVWDTIIAPILDKLGFLDPITEAWENFKKSFSGILDGIGGAATSALSYIQPLLDALRWIWDNGAAAVASVSGFFGGGGAPQQPQVGPNSSTGNSSSPRLLPGVMELASLPSFNDYQSSLAGDAGATNNTTTVNTELSVGLPAGAPATQKAFVEQEILPVIRQTIENAVMSTATNYQGAG